MQIFNRRTEFTTHQLNYLEEFYQKDNKPNSSEIDLIARYVNLKFEITQVIYLYISIHNSCLTTWIIIKKLKNLIKHFESLIELDFILVIIFSL